MSASGIRGCGGWSAGRAQVDGQGVRQAGRIGLTPGSVSRMIDRLADAGCVRRVPDPHDRQRNLVEPTEAGLATAEVDRLRQAGQPTSDKADRG
jgi:DNA-binding MarR family transcriptional regulator